MNTQLLVLAKAPVAGRVKTRLCPPCTPDEAAALARACLLDTIEAVAATPAASRTVVLDRTGWPARTPLPVGGLAVVDQRGDGLDRRLAAAFEDTARPRTASILIGMDTPHVTPARLIRAVRLLSDADAVLGPADDGGWWLLGLRDPGHAAALIGVPMSRPETGAVTRTALRARGLRIATTETLRDVDTADDARHVAALAPRSRFAAAWASPVHRAALPVGAR